MKNALSTAIAALALSLLPISSASAQSTAKGTLYVFANVQPYCSVFSGSVDFGTITSLPTNSTGQIGVACPSSVVYHIAFDAGQNYNGSWRQISDGTDKLLYGLFQPTTGMEWGDSDYDNTYSWGSSVGGTGTGAVEWYTINATLLASTSIVPPGYYSDVVQVTVHY